MGSYINCEEVYRLIGTPLSQLIRCSLVIKDVQTTMLKTARKSKTGSIDT